MLKKLTFHATVEVLLLSLAAAARADNLTVIGHTPGINASNVPIRTSIRIDFDRPIKRSSVDGDNFWAYGRSTGLVTGAVSYDNGDATATLTPDRPFAAGETVTVILSHDLKGADGIKLRPQGYAFRFGTRTRPNPMNFQTVQVLSTGPAGTTRIYGAAATDLNRDGAIDLTTVNEVSADLRVFLNLNNGQGTYGSMLNPPLSIGVEASPNDSGDFNRDGRIDLATCASDDDGVWVALGKGDGTYRTPPQRVAAGSEPHGISTLDVDGDGDLDLVNANRASNNLGLMLNDGNGVFGVIAFFEGGVEGEYGLDAGDLNADGILDLVVAGRDGQHLRGLLSNGDGTFTQAARRNTGGATWVLNLGDVNGDGKLDAAAANSFSGHGAILIGNGDGTFQPATTYPMGGHTASNDLGDLDGDGDLDLVLSSYGAGIWRIFTNNGSGLFTPFRDIPATSNPSCSILLDIDGDRDLDLALTDEIADTVTLQKNTGTARFGDFDLNGKVDLADWKLFTGCLDGPGVDAGFPCGHADADGDGDVDLADAAAFQNAFTGS